MLAIAKAAREPNTPGWTVRVVPNLYPAFRRHEVIIHSPRHVRSFADLSDDELGALAAVWEDRTKRAGRRDRRRQRKHGYMFWSANEGRAAGASLAHSHSQLVWFENPPPAVDVEFRTQTCGVCDVVAENQELVIAKLEGHIALVHPAGRVPYEVLIATGHAWLAYEPALRLLRKIVRRLRVIEGPLAWNAWLHGDRVHPHLELVPRMTVFAGIELGAGVYINPLAPEEAAARLRG